ncbi:MAG: methionine biosynthesis protein MetW [Candidatus Omnitrophica bacterium]|nr:methionine biosynthesis protein MetW [Candidatus Omnitrophota bacterium]
MTRVGLAFLLIQAILIPAGVPDGGDYPAANLAGIKAEMLSPRLYCDAAGLHTVFLHYADSGLLKTASEFAPDERKSRPENAVLRAEADSLDQGYKKLDDWVAQASRADGRPLIICVDGDVSAGKTTLVNIIQQRGFRTVPARAIVCGQIDSIVNAAAESFGSISDAVLEAPFILEKFIRSAPTTARVIIVEGTEAAGYYMPRSGFSADITVVCEAPRRVRFKRALMQQGIFAIKFFNEGEFVPDFPESVPRLIIHNRGQGEPAWSKVLFVAGLKTVGLLAQVTARYCIPPAARESAETWFNRITGVSVLQVLLLPLRLTVWLIERGIAVYFMFRSERDMAAIIKKHFGKRYLRVLDVGTHDGRFVEAFQNLLDNKRIGAEVIGIDINPGAVVRGMNQGRKVQCLDVKDAVDHFGRECFDLIVINAPESGPEYLVRRSMNVLKKDGMIVLRFDNGMHYRARFGSGYKYQLMKDLDSDYTVVDVKRNLHNLPGTAYRLQAPIIITYKQPREYEEILKNDPNDLTALAALAGIYYEQGDIERAVKFFRLAHLKSGGKEKSIELGFSSALKALVLLRVKQKNFKEAFQQYAIIKKLFGDDEKAGDEFIPACLDEAAWLREKGQYNAAIEMYRRLTAIDPAHASQYVFYAGEVAVLKNDKESAVEYFTRADEYSGRADPVFRLYSLLAQSIRVNKPLGSDNWGESTSVHNGKEPREALVPAVSALLKENGQAIADFLTGQSAPVLPVYNQLIAEYNRYRQSLVQPNVAEMRPVLLQKRTEITQNIALKFEQAI